MSPYELDIAPHEALGRAARKLNGGGALYLGGGVGVERQGPRDTGKFVVSEAGKKGSQSFGGPLSAVTQAYKQAGSSTAADSPGGATSITDPAVAARVREIDASIAEKRRDIDRYERRVAATEKNFLSRSSDGWEQRYLDEARTALASLRAERARLLGGDLREEVGKPGTNWKQVSPAARKKLGGILAHYRKMAHPFTQCVADNTKRFGPERAKRVCAVVKDLNERSTKWRKGGGKRVSEEVALMLDEACERLAALDANLGEGTVFALVEGDADLSNPTLAGLAEMAWADVGLLALAGHPMAELLIEGAKPDAPRHRDGQWTNVLARITKNEEPHPLQVASPNTDTAAVPVPSVTESLLDSRPVLVEADFTEKLHPRDFLGRFKAKVAGLKVGDSATVPGGITVKREEEGFAITGGAGLGHYKHESGEMRTGKPAADEKLSSSNSAAMLAVTRSLRSRDPKSLGGDKHYQSFEDYEKEHGKPGDAQRQVIAKWRGRLDASSADRIEKIASREAFSVDNSPELKAEWAKLQSEAAALKKKPPVREAEASLIGSLLDPRLVETFDESKVKRQQKGSSGGGQFAKKGSSGEETKGIQRRIGQKEDGAFGDKTEAAVKRFQKRHGLKVDGVVGHQTASALTKGDTKEKVGALTGDDRKRLKKLSGKRPAKIREHDSGVLGTLLESRSG